MRHYKLIHEIVSTKWKVFMSLRSVLLLLVCFLISCEDQSAYSRWSLVVLTICQALWNGCYFLFTFFTYERQTQMLESKLPRVVCSYFCRRMSFQSGSIWNLKKKNLNLYQRVVQMFAEAKRADHEAEYHKGAEYCMRENHRFAF